jgi:hypothetical protein
VAHQNACTFADATSQFFELPSRGLLVVVGVGALYVVTLYYCKCVAV